MGYKVLEDPYGYCWVLNRVTDHIDPYSNRKGILPLGNLASQLLKSHNFQDLFTKWYYHIEIELQRLKSKCIRRKGTTME